MVNLDFESHGNLEVVRFEYDLCFPTKNPHASCALVIIAESTEYDDTTKQQAATLIMFVRDFLLQIYCYLFYAAISAPVGKMNKSWEVT